MSSFRQWVRQRRFPPEFRIQEPPDGPATTPGPAPPVEVATSDLDDPTVADVATNLWRVLKRFGDNGDAGKAERMARRNLTAMSDRLSEAGVRVQDHDGTPWDPGMSLRAIAYEPRPGLDRETVVETVRPTVYRGGQCIQFGHVIVGVPEKGQDNGTGQH
ncbi:hypothetical protein [Amycolatopsis albispora]|uniref:Nucleotide exchange factor GrpE n=1 Tax=Amycolatopsis albispora TaxID=1804986 RepID=A0A344L0H0_9PSEU|nr:hypothetical protein [Amycolatopsis albispora]AXB41544.1 hypothetical protein A4R43_02590 [Amycolatopsis albispora]